MSIFHTLDYDSNILDDFLFNFLSITDMKIIFQVNTYYSNKIRQHKRYKNYKKFYVALKDIRIYDINFYFNTHIEHEFIKACAYGSTEIINQLIKKININSINPNKLFIITCTRGSINNVLYIYDNIIKDINTIDLKSRSDIFKICTDYGKLPTAKWLYELCKSKNIDLDLNINFIIALKWAAVYGRTDLIKWLHSLNMNIDLHFDNDYIYRKLQSHKNLNLNLSI